MLDLIHEFDYVTWLMGEVETVACLNDSTETLDIETEDVCEVLLRFDNGAIGTIHLDYLQPKLVRNCLITGTGGSITWNLAESRVTWIKTDKSEGEFSYKGFERNARFVEIMQCFLEGTKDSRLSSFEDALESLSVVVAAKESAKRKRFVKVAKAVIKESQL